MNDTNPQTEADATPSGGQPSAKAQLRQALVTALAQYQETMGEAFPTAPKLYVVDHPDFWALAEMVGDVFTIRVSTVTVAAVERLWQDAKTTEELSSLEATAEELTHVSLVWLMLHELHHFEMGHFQIVDKAYLTETFGAHQFTVAKRAKRPRMLKSRALRRIKRKDRRKVEPCLEMQADHDAMEMLLDAYSPGGWPSLRHRAAAISAMMMLIEREDAKHEQEQSSHPKAATRIFQLLRHLNQMPSIEEFLAEQHPELGIDPYIPDDDEIEAYADEVLTLAFLDAKALATIGNAASIADDLGDQENFFKDVKSAISGKPSYLQTTGAVEWAELIAVNSQLLSA